jgi:uncharacterized repeat protein (TIGR03803 family)
MRSRKISAGWKLTNSVFALILCVIPGNAQTTKNLHDFLDSQGYNQVAVIFGPDGNLYGATAQGGQSGVGAVYRLTPTVSGPWRETRVHYFGGNRGSFPNQGLRFDSEGNLYGTLQEGGAFELSTAPDGGWHQTFLSSSSSSEGVYPEAGLIPDGNGNLYSTAWGGGEYNHGIVFELSPQAGGGWTTTTLHSFGNGSDGAVLKAGLIFDAHGNLYGVTVCGGAAKEVNTSFYPDCGGAPGAGTVFEMSPQADGSWAETTLYSFTGGVDGGFPDMTPNLVFDSAGNLYGTTEAGGAFNLGTVFELSPNGDGGWTERVLHSFNGANGSYPRSALIFDAAGNLYGEAYTGGGSRAGLVYELVAVTGGGWRYKVLRSFYGIDGAGPRVGLIWDSAGNLYGTTDHGGTYGNGTVFEISP